MENIGGSALSKPLQDAPPPPVIQEDPVASKRISPSIISMEPVVEEIREKEPLPVIESEPEIPEPPHAPVIVPVPAPEIISVPEPGAQEPPVTPPAPEPVPDKIPQQEKPQKIAFDLFSNGAGITLADRLREGQDKSLADKLQENKVVDLRTTIGINDKFLFINELFEGNMRIYDEVILKLNSAVTMAQADLLMLDLKIAYNWDSESPTVKKFVELVRRKF
jgi:hypothetical protein